MQTNISYTVILGPQFVIQVRKFRLDFGMPSKVGNAGLIL